MFISFSDKTADLVNLQYYVIKEKKLKEKEAVIIFFDLVRVISNLHEVGLDDFVLPKTTVLLLKLFFPMS